MVHGPFFLQLFLGSAPVLQRNEIFIASNRQENNTTQNIYYNYIAGKIHLQVSPGKAAVEKTGQLVQKSAR